MQITESNVIQYRHEGDFYFSYGVKAFQTKRFERAEKWFQKSLELQPTNPLYLSQLSVLYTEIGQYHRANDLLQKVIDHHGHAYPDCFYLLANNYAHLGLFYEAKKFGDKYLEHQEDGDFRDEVVQLLDMLEQLSTDEHDEDDLEFDDLDEIIMHQETAFYHLEHEEWDEAIEVLEEMMTFYPEYISAKHEYAYALFRSGDEEEAITLEEAWFEQDPTSLHSRLNLVYFYYSSGKNSEFQELLPTLLNVYPTYEPQKLKLAITLARVEEYGLALPRFQQINNRQVSNYLSYYYWFSKVLAKNEMYEKSDQIWKQGIKKHPSLQSFD
ncbi:tetratricopeptide repeat protein [Piscibacillus halophilus]|uniref:Tetratricopeptide repeat-containing protein n=1 Tax=Piscibacillus halophilus TaxID=571933 RepID=A0A1H9EEB3_9BACI|nr:tetratricopeptide repeat protein [Piscibacillus halophilus]SEQ23902.1 Tetratricopeptide repeat-containing protein [Piscibacillus halophilus]